MSGVFINYRRDDTAPYAGRLYDHLRRTFPNTKVFMDIDAIDPGEDFVQAINQTLSISKVVLVVIGPRWEKVTDQNGDRRLDNPDDHVVRELSAALQSDARVIPVLVGGAVMPRTDALPICLQALARRNAIELSDTRFVADAERLSAAIAKVIATSQIVKKHEKTEQSEAKKSDYLTQSISTLKIFLWISYGLGVFGFFIQLTKKPDDEIGGYFIVAILLLGLFAWFNVMLSRGKRWARTVYLILLILSIPAIFLEWASQSGFEIIIGFVSLGLSGWILRLMFTDPLKAIFQKPS